jgi:imidazolonepropionase-like amidohydrolase
MGRTVATHCHGTGCIRNSVLAGVDTIEHGSYLDDETAALMAEHGTALVLTLAVARPDLDKVPPSEQAEFERLAPILAKLSEQTQHAIAAARKSNVLIGIGTDAGGNPLAPHDFSLSRELEHLVSSGFTPLEALTIATRNNAQILKWSHDIGTLVTGKLADLVVLSADPLVDIGNVRAVGTVYKGGAAVPMNM